MPRICLQKNKQILWQAATMHMFAQHTFIISTRKRSAHTIRNYTRAHLANALVCHCRPMHSSMASQCMRLLLMILFHFVVVFVVDVFPSRKRLKTLSTFMDCDEERLGFVCVWFSTNGSVRVSCGFNCKKKAEWKKKQTKKRTNTGEWHIKTYETTMCSVHIKWQWQVS